MTTGAERARGQRAARRASLVLALPVLWFFAGCRERAPTDALPELGPACAAACATLVGARCFDEEDAIAAQRRCLAGCNESAKSSRAVDCGRELVAYLTCLGESNTAQCPKTLPSIRFLDHPSVLSGCAEPAQAHRECTRPCRDAGVVHTASIPHTGASGVGTVHAEVVGLGCTSGPAEPPRKTAAGAPCTHHSVCTAVRCECAGGRGAYLARACVAGRCAGSESVCFEAPKAVGYQVCR